MKFNISILKVIKVMKIYKQNRELFFHTMHILEGLFFHVVLSLVSLHKKLISSNNLMLVAFNGYMKMRDIKQLTSGCVCMPTMFRGHHVEMKLPR